MRPLDLHLMAWHVQTSAFTPLLPLHLQPFSPVHAEQIWVKERTACALFSDLPSGGRARGPLTPSGSPCSRMHLPYGDTPASGLLPAPTRCPSPGSSPQPSRKGREATQSGRDAGLQPLQTREVVADPVP